MRPCLTSFSSARRHRNTILATRIATKATLIHLIKCNRNAPLKEIQYVKSRTLSFANTGNRCVLSRVLAHRAGVDDIASVFQWGHRNLWEGHVLSLVARWILFTSYIFHSIPIYSQYSETKHNMLKHMYKIGFLEAYIDQYVLAKIIALIVFAAPPSWCGISRCVSKRRNTDRLSKETSAKVTFETLANSPVEGYNCAVTTMLRCVIDRGSWSLHCWQNLSWARRRRWFHRSWRKLTLREHYPAHRRKSKRSCYILRHRIRQRLFEQNSTSVKEIRLRVATLVTNTPRSVQHHSCSERGTDSSRFVAEEHDVIARAFDKGQTMVSMLLFVETASF